jgi:hypothetical protein
VFRLIQAGPHTLFRLLTDRQCHAQLDGYGMLRVWGYARMPLLTVGCLGLLAGCGRPWSAAWRTSLRSLTTCFGLSPKLLAPESIDDGRRWLRV